MARKRRKKVGRPPTITKSVIKEVKQYIMSGTTLTDACRLAGTSYKTWNQYERSHLSLRANRKTWEKMLAAQSRIVIANSVYNKKDPSWASYVLDHEMALEVKRANNELVKAKARKMNAETEMIERQNQQANQIADSTLDNISKLSVDELRKLASLRDVMGDDDSAVLKD